MRTRTCLRTRGVAHTRRIGTTSNLSFLELEGVYGRSVIRNSGSTPQPPNINSKPDFPELEGASAYSPESMGSSVRIAGKFKDQRAKQKFRLCYSHEFVGTDADRSAYKAAVAEQVPALSPSRPRARAIFHSPDLPRSGLPRPPLSPLPLPPASRSPAPPLPCSCSASPLPQPHVALCRRRSPRRGAGARV